jgi:DNA-binding response OmpR family regulator
VVQLANILIVTRDPEVARLDGRLQFEGLRGWQVDSYSSAAETLGRIGKCVALIDGDMPEEETFQIYALLHGERVVPTLMLMPGQSYYQMIQDPHRHQADDFVQKPARVEELVFRLKALILRAGYDLPSRRGGTTAEQPEEATDRQGRRPQVSQRRR